MKSLHATVFSPTPLPLFPLILGPGTKFAALKTHNLPTSEQVADPRISLKHGRSSLIACACCCEERLSLENISFYVAFHTRRGKVLQED